MDHLSTEQVNEIYILKLNGDFSRKSSNFYAAENKGECSVSCSIVSRNRKIFILGNLILSLYY